MKVGDTVKLKPAMWQGIRPEAYGLSFTGEYVVSTVYEDQEYPSLRIEGITGTFDVEAFQLVVKGEEKYVYKGWNLPIKYKDQSKLNADELNILHLFKQTADDLEEDKLKKQSIERPVLEERKKDKIRMELVDQGFPLALLELAKVMTWANSNKGYKDHDWKNIPDAENAFKGAAARHRVKFDAQRSFGSEMLDCTDEESGIIHLAHECFNNLALLELALAGKVK